MTSSASVWRRRCGTRRKCEFVAVARAHAAQAEAFAAEFGAATSYADWRDMIVDPAVDAVYVATPVHLHAEQTIAAAEAGKHVLCEKPMALDVAECDRMIAACRAHGVRLGIAYYRHFYPVVRRDEGTARRAARSAILCTRRSTRSSGSICRPTILGPGFCNVRSQGAAPCSTSAAIGSRS